MPELPRHIKQTFYNVISTRMAMDAFEQWVYTNQELEQALPADGYLELISLNYQKDGAGYELFSLLQRFVGAGEYEKWKLIGLLHQAKVRDLNLPVLLEEFYYLYCDGYEFLNTLGMGFGLAMCVLPKPYKVEHWRQLQTAEVLQLVQSLPMLIINHEADIVLRWLDQGEIVLTGEQNELNRHGFVDNRSNVDKARVPQYNLTRSFGVQK